MTVRVGIVGVGNIGQDHIRRLTQPLSGAQVVAVADVDSARAETVARGVPSARVFPSGRDLIGSRDVDAVVVSSWGMTHEEFVLAAIEQGKPVFCEKPLAPTPEACLRIVEAEMACGRRLVQVGFMRRYDAAYLALKRSLTESALGPVLMMHCVHRNASVPSAIFTSDMLITDAAIHEIDIVRWLLNQEIAAAMAVLKPRRTTRADARLQDPQIVILETAEGVIVDIEVFVNCVYGYDVRCEVVGESGAASLGDTSTITIRRGGLSAGRVPPGWRERFGSAYDAELREWVESVIVGEARGPSAWDGYAGAAVSDSCLRTLESSHRTPVQLERRPEFYDTVV